MKFTEKYMLQTRRTCFGTIISMCKLTIANFKNPIV